MKKRQPSSANPHPVSTTARKEIMLRLKRIEKEEDVKIIYACESGSRAWGFASPDSDYDVRFIYKHPIEWYLRIEDERDVIERPISDDLDINGWELRKALRLMRRSNPTLFEWLDSPIVYRQHARSVKGLRALIPEFFAPFRARHHYLSMARRNFTASLQGKTVRHKKYFYALRPLLAVLWIDQKKTMPPTRFFELLRATVTDADILGEIEQLLELKRRAREIAVGPIRPRLHAFIEAELARPDVDRLPRPTVGDSSHLHQYFAKTVLGS